MGTSLFVDNPISRAVLGGVGKLVYKSGLLDKLTGGKATRFFTTIRNWIQPNVGTKTDYSANVKSVADTVGQGGNMTTSYLKKNM